jgi:hypothetical protein
MAHTARVDITDHDGRVLRRESIDEPTAHDALLAQRTIYQSAREEFGREIYIFTHWASGAPCGP